MAEDEPLKSAYEVALERLRRQDREAGVEQPAPLTAEAKREIARLREQARAKLAELEILQRQKLAEASGDPEKLREVEEHYAIDRRRVESSLESAISKIRRGEAG